MKKKCFLIGHPLGHSVSPAMHNAGYKNLKLDFEYSLLEIEPKDLEKEIQKLRAPSVAGFNVTIPHKEAVLALLDEVTKLAERIGAVNTVKNQDGRLIGYNTDGPGFIDSLKEDAGVDPKGKRVVLLGAGGAGRAIGLCLCEAGIKSLIIQDPRSDKLDDLTEYLSDLFDIKICRSEDLQREASQADLLINASPIGMSPKIEACPLPEQIKLSAGQIVYDIVYNPRETLLLKRASEAGATAISGLGMLVRQAALAFTIFTGEPAPFDTMQKAAQSAVGR